MKKLLICLLMLFSITYAETAWKWGNCVYNNNTSAYVTENDSITNNGSYTTKAYLFDSSSINPVCNSAETAYYKVNYLAGGGTGSMSQSTFEYGVASTLPACGFRKSGYTFTRWNNGAGTYYTNQGTISGGCNTSQNCAVNLTAEWSINKYSISYNLNGGSASGLKTSYYVTESFTLPTPSRSGYVFTGWTGSNGTTPQTSVTVQKGTTGNLSYTANWKELNYYYDVSLNVTSGLSRDFTGSWASIPLRVKIWKNNTIQVISGSTSYTSGSGYKNKSSLVVYHALSGSLNGIYDENGNAISGSYAGKTLKVNIYTNFNMGSVSSAPTLTIKTSGVSGGMGQTAVWSCGEFAATLTNHVSISLSAS